MRRHLSNGGRVSVEGQRLPDEDEVAGRGLHWAAGAAEGAAARHAGSDRAAAAEQARALHDAFLRLAEQPSPAARRALSGLLRDLSYPRGVVDPLLDLLRAEPSSVPERLYGEARRLMAEGTHRNEVKIAMAVTSLARDSGDAEAFRTLGRHDEFTIYAAVALARVVADPISEWIGLARGSGGWAKVELFELLLHHGRDRPEVLEFLRTEPLPEGVLAGYVAFPIASGCRLHEALAAPNISRAELTAAGAILRVLAQDALEGGPDGTMVDYPEAGRAAEAILRHYQVAASDFEDFVVVDSLRRFGIQADPEDLEQCGWGGDVGARLVASSEEIERWPRWRVLAEEILDQQDERFHEAFEVARRLGLPVRERIIAWLERHPLDGPMWYWLARSIEPSTIDETIALALRLVAPAELATGPAEELGLGPSFERHRHLLFILQELPRFPGKGWELCRYALRSPVIRNRNMALRVLMAWDSAAAGPGVRQAVGRCLEDPVESTRQLAAKALEAWSSAG